jgi:hypothetical protein
VTVYVDDARIPARVGGTRARWSHLTADTEPELHAFARQIGLRPGWYQRQCKSRCGDPCVHWHYDVTHPKRAAAIVAGARTVGIRELGDIIRARRATIRAATQGEDGTS